MSSHSTVSLADIYLAGISWTLLIGLEPQHANTKYMIARIHASPGLLPLCFQAVRRQLSQGNEAFMA